MDTLSRVIAVLFASLFFLNATSALNYSFPYGKDKIRGVGLGGWLVVDPWITPTLFDNTGNASIIDEWTFCQYQQHSAAQSALQKHWRTWITEDDFAAIAAAGLNHVKIPIGYWAFDVSEGEPYVQGQLPYVIKAVSWAEKYGLKVIVDLFGAPGSQNGFVTSGRILPSPTWQKLQSNIDRTNAIVKKMASMFAKQTHVVTVIAPLNEPALGDEELMSVTRQYFYDSYGNIRYPYGTSQQSNAIVMISEAYQPLSFWDNFMPPPKWEGVMIDNRNYQIWSDSDNALNHSQHISNICSMKSILANSPLWTVVGEWTTAATDCARSINGRGVGSRYDGTYPGSARVGSCVGLTGNASTFSPSYKTFLRQFWEAQVQTYEGGSQGWLQWLWKAENADDWSYQAGLANGWIPRNPVDYNYPVICDEA